MKANEQLDLFEHQMQNAKNAIETARTFLGSAAEQAAEDNDAEKLARCLVAESSLRDLLERLDTGFKDCLDDKNYDYSDKHTACDFCESRDPRDCFDCIDFWH